MFLLQRLFFIVFLFIFLPISARDYNSVQYPEKNMVFCTPEQIIKEGKTGCYAVKGDLNLTFWPFTDAQQTLFHSVRLYRGRIILKNCNLKRLHAFKNLWDIEISDPANVGPQWLEDDPGFQVEGNAELTDIDLGSLISFSSTHYQGFRIRHNGEYRMPLAQMKELHRVTNNRDLYADIDLANAPRNRDRFYSTAVVIVGHLAVVSIILASFLFVLLYLLCYRSADDVFRRKHSKPYEELLTESKKARQEALTMEKKHKIQ